MHDIFAFSYLYPVKDLEAEYLGNGWDIYRNPEDEFKRMGIDFMKVRNTIYKSNFNLKYIDSLFLIVFES